MRLSLLVLLVLVAVTVVSAQTQKQVEDVRLKALTQLGKMKKYFQEDDLGKMIVDQFKDLGEILMETKTRLRQKLAAYVRDLDKET